MDDLPAPGTMDELWWVAVACADTDDGGWLVLADPNETGAAQIQTVFEQAGIGVLAAVSARDLAGALGANDPQERTVAWRTNPDGQLIMQVLPGAPAQVLVELREAFPEDRIVLGESQDPARALLARMQRSLASDDFEGVRMDLRAAPRGQGTAGLLMARAA